MWCLQFLALCARSFESCFVVGVRLDSKMKLPVLQVELKDHLMLFDDVEEACAQVERYVSSRLKQVEGEGEK